MVPGNVCKSKITNVGIHGQCSGVCVCSKGRKMEVVVGGGGGMSPAIKNRPK